MTKPSQNHSLIVNKIRTAAVGLAVGDMSRSVVCPFCGDSSGDALIERSATGVHLYCFRASCPSPEKGYFVPDITSVPTTPPQEKRKKFDKSIVELIQLPKRWRKYLQETYGLTKEEIRENQIKFNEVTGSVIFPIFDSIGEEIGIVDRSYTGRNPKAIVHMYNNKAPKLAWPVHNNDESRTVIIVEDIVSAIRCARYEPAVALLGTSINDMQLNDIITSADYVIEILDKDTWYPHPTQSLVGWKPIPIRHKQLHQNWFISWTAIEPPKDPKDLADAELKELIYGTYSKLTAEI